MNRFLVALFGGLLFPFISMAFSDVSDTYRFFDAIEYAQENDWMNGYQDGKFYPEKSITRAELIKIVIHSSFSLSEIKNCDISMYSFSDVSAKNWAAPYVCMAKKHGIVKGYVNGTFSPNSPVILAEAMKIIILSNHVDITSHIPNSEDMQMIIGPLDMSIQEAKDYFWYYEYMSYFLHKIYTAEKFPKFPTDEHILLEGFHTSAIQHLLSRAETAYILQSVFISTSALTCTMPTINPLPAGCWYSFQGCEAQVECSTPSANPTTIPTKTFTPASTPTPTPTPTPTAFVSQCPVPSLTPLSSGCIYVPNITARGCLWYKTVCPTNMPTFIPTPSATPTALITIAPVACTMEYAPVCGMPSGRCTSGVNCSSTPFTYSNKCSLQADQAIFLYEGICQSI